MITLVEALNYRSLRYVHRPLGPFHVLVGPNASGKTTFLDVVGFLRDMVANGLDQALAERTPDPRDLLFRGRGVPRLELAVEARIPDDLRRSAMKPDLDTVRYQVALGVDRTDGPFEFKAETLMLKKTTPVSSAPQPFFPSVRPRPDSLQISIRRRNNKVVINKAPKGNDNFYNEAKRPDEGWAPSFRLGPRKSALGNLPADAASFPVATWFREHLDEGLQRFVLNSRTIRRPSPPTKVAGFEPDGSNLPWVITRMKEQRPERYGDWIGHLRTALPDLEDIDVVERPEDRHRYMIYTYRNGLKAPSWLVSDGTLRLTVLTLPAYLADFRGIYLIEEPENGIHPGAVATVYDSLSSVYDAQVLLATHSPVVLNAARPDDVLCFARDEEGATDIVAGPEHPTLRQWRGEADLGTLLASGVLG